MPFVARQWQEECLLRFQQKIEEGSTSFVFEACMGAGKSAEAALISKVLLNEYVDHVLVLVPWRSIQGDVEKGMLGTFGLMGLDVRDHFFTFKRRQARQPRPQMDATIALYQEVCNEQAIETLKMWKSSDDFTFALICDEIHHTNEIDSSWGTYVEQLSQLAKYSIFMSGTYFRGDRKPISCIPLDADGIPIKDYRFTYANGVKENVVRSVTTRDIDANVLIYDKNKDLKYELTLKEIGKKELAEAKKQVLDPNGECVRHIIETAHQALLQTRTKFPDAACLYVCRPGGGDNYTRDGGESQEDRHVHAIAKQIQAITGETPTVVTHRDRDAQGKISCFRRANSMYLVAVNMVSEGCDIPRLRAVAFCRYTNSEMLFRQIVGRALRLHAPEDGTAAQIYIPAFPVLLDYAERLYSEAQEGIINRRCAQCGEWPCQCPCPDCGNHPCDCDQWLFPQREPMLLAIDATPVADGGHVGEDHVPEYYVGYAVRISQENDAHRHANHTQLGHAFQRFVQMQQQANQQQPQASAPEINPGMEREKLRRSINRYVRRLAYSIYEKDFQKAYVQEIETPFHAKFKEIINTWGVDKLRQVNDALERRIVEVFRRG
jgi:superfamily II DNA or RNA helicase